MGETFLTGLQLNRALVYVSVLSMYCRLLPGILAKSAIVLLTVSVAISVPVPALVSTAGFEVV